jgi:hypothetical protein
LKTGGTSNCIAERDISFSVPYSGVLKRGGMSLGKRPVASGECLHAARREHGSKSKCIKKYYEQPIGSATPAATAS